MHTYICKKRYNNTYNHSCMDTYIHALRTCNHTYIRYVHICIHTCINYIHGCIHTYITIHKYIQPYIHTKKQTNNH